MRIWRQNFKFENFALSFGKLTTSKNSTRVHAARAARLFFLIQPIRSLFSGVAVGNVVVLALTPLCKISRTLANLTTVVKTLNSLHFTENPKKVKKK